jgi:hypothetical protein
MRMRWTMAAVAAATFGGPMLFVAAASALEIGPVSVPVTLPTVGPVVVEAPPAVAPGLGVTATVSPETGVAIDVTTPTAIGPITLPALAPPELHVAIAAPVPAPPAIGGPTAGSAPSSGSPLSASRWLVPIPAARPSTVAGAGSTPADNAAVHPSSVPRPAVVEDTAGAVNASLRHAALGKDWSLWREVTSTRMMLLLALLLIVFVARWVMGGFMRDALRRTRVSSA